MIDIDTINKYLTNDVVISILEDFQIDYRKENGWITTRCIWHNSQKFNLKWKDGAWYCFSECGKKYSMFDFVMKQLDIDFTEALEWLCNFLGLAENDVKFNQNKQEARNKLKKLKKLTQKRVKKAEYEQVDQYILNDIEPFIHPYILQQGFKEKTLKAFNIGFARAGILDQRVCFPIDAPDGTTISVSGRSIIGEEPKYYIVGDTEKSQTLYNISRIDKNDDYIIVVEGFKSCFWFYENGYKSVVATMGSSISDNQIKLLLRLGRKVLCVGDMDSAGRTLNQKIYNHLYKYLDVVKVDMREFTDFEGDSPCDLDFDGGCDLIDKIQEIIDGN